MVDGLSRLIGKVSLSVEMSEPVPDLTIRFAGGGIGVNALRALSRSSIVEAHVGRAARVPPAVDGAVSSRKVAELVEAARR